MHLTTTTCKIPYSYLALEYAHFRDRIQVEVLDRIAAEAERGHFTIGSAIVEFEEAFAHATGYGYAVGVNSGTDALFLSLKALHIGKGHPVLTVPNTFMATVGAIVAAGAYPVFCDVGPDYLMNTKSINRSRGIDAIIPVELTGRSVSGLDWFGPAIPIILDSAQAVGAKRQRKGLLGCYSLHPLKNVHVWGDGGVVCTDDYGLYQDLKLLRNHGSPDRDTTLVPGHNSRLDTIQAIVGLFSLSNLEWVTTRRRANAAFYDKNLTGIEGITLPARGESDAEVFHTYVIQAEDRDGLRASMDLLGIECKIHYPIPLHLQPAYQYLGYEPGAFPVAESQARRILSLPIHEYLTMDQLEYVVSAIRGYYG